MTQEKKFCHYCGDACSARNPVYTYSFDLLRQGSTNAHTKADVQLCLKCFNKYARPLIDVLEEMKKRYEYEQSRN